MSRSLSPVLWCALIVPAALAASPAAAAAGTDCFRDLLRGRGAEIVCTYPVRPSDGERADLQRISRGYVVDAQCTVSVRIPRALIDEAVAMRDHVFTSPPQPVTCEVTTKGRDTMTVTPITGHFAPQVTIKDGKAIDATPGLANVQGVTRALSLPVEYWVNRGSHVKTGLLQAINAWLDHLRHDRPQRQAATR